MRVPYRLRRGRLSALLILLVSVTLCAAAVRSSEAGLRYEKIVGAVGQQIPVADGWVQVDDVRIGRTLVANNEELGRTDGMFVVVRATIAATGDHNASFGNAEVVAHDRTYQNWTDYTLAADPDYRSSVDIAFEVDPEQMADLTLVLWPVALITGYDQRVAVPLGITADNASQWQAAAAGRTVQVQNRPSQRGLR